MICKANFLREAEFSGAFPFLALQSPSLKVIASIVMVIPNKD